MLQCIYSLYYVLQVEGQVEALPFGTLQDFQQFSLTSLI